MPVFNIFLKLMYKNRRSIMMYLIIFLLVIIMFAFSGISSSNQFRSTSATFTVIDRDNGGIGEYLKKQLNQNNEYVSCKDDQQSIQDALFYRRAQVIIIIPKGFTASFKDGKEPKLQTMQIENSMASTLMKQELNSSLKALTIYQTEGYSYTDAMSQAIQNQKISTSVTLLPSGNQDESVFYYYFRFVPYILISLTLCGMSPVISTLQKKEIRKRNICSSYPLWKQNRELILGAFAFSFGAMLIVDLVGYLFFSQGISTSLFLFTFINTFLQMLVSMALSFCISYCLTSNAALNASANVISLGCSFLGGVFVPLSFLNHSLLRISHFIPVYWYTTANNLLTKSGSWAGANKPLVLQCFAIQIMFALAILVLALIISKKRYQIS